MFDIANKVPHPGYRPEYAILTPALISMEYHIKQYGLQQGALEIEYIEEFFGEFPRRKNMAEVVERL